MWAYIKVGDKLKCRYSYCKHNNEVNKEDAVKEGNSYYHKDCLKEKQLKSEIESYFLSNMPSTTMQLLRKVIKQLIHEKHYSAEYVLFVLKYIKNNNKPINNPFGLINYCGDNRIYTLFNKQEINKKFKEIDMGTEYIPKEESEVKFTYKNSNKKITDII